MRGRIYDTVQRRFLTRDPVLDNPYEVGGAGSYTYVRNNPPNLTDPTGFMGEDPSSDAFRTEVQGSESRSIGDFESRAHSEAMQQSAPQMGMNNSMSGIGASMEQGRMAQSMSMAPGGFSGPTSMGNSGESYGGNSPSAAPDARSGMGPLASPSPGSQPRGGANPSYLDRALDWLFPPTNPLMNVGVIWVPGMPLGAPSARGVEGLDLLAKNGSKLAQQIARWRAIGGQGGAPKFLRYAGRLGAEARATGQVVTGTVGTGPQALQNATIYRRGTEYLVVHGNTIMSYVSQARSGGDRQRVHSIGRRAMSHVVLVGAPKLAAIVELLQNEIRLGTDWWVGVLAPDDAANLNYRDSVDSFPRLAARLNSGELSSIQMRRERSSLLLVGLYAPKFCDEPFNQWRCILEGSEDEVAHLYDACRNSDEVPFVSLSVDEAPELLGDYVSADEFPWNDWRLVRAAVRTPDGKWEERNGTSG